MEEKTNQFEKTLVINGTSFFHILKCVEILMICMKETNEKHEQILLFFQMRLKDSEKSINSKELELRWATTDDKTKDSGPAI
jgi:hypothetical protein